MSRAVLQRWLQVAIIALVSLVLSAAYLLLAPNEYTAATTNYISAQGIDNAQSAYQGSLLSEQRVKSYSELILSDRVLGEVQRRLGLNRTLDQIRQQVAVTNEPDTVILQISATDRDPQVAAQISNSVSEVFVLLVAEVEQPADRNLSPPVAAKIVQLAAPPSDPSSPKVFDSVAFALLAGLLVGVAAAIALELADNTIKSADDVEDENSVILSSIEARKPGAAARKLENDRAILESYRKLRTNLRFVQVDAPPSVIGVTSAVPGDGKTSLSLNLAASIVESGASVVLVEADLRRPTLENELGIDAPLGLSDLLAGRAAIERVLTYRAGLAVITAGRRPPNPAELLGSERARTLLSELSERFDQVIVDTPPLLAVTDGAVLSNSVDAMLMVVRWGSTKRREVVEARAELTRVGAPFVGYVIMANPTGPRSYSAYIDAPIDQEAKPENGDSASTDVLNRRHAANVSDDVRVSDSRAPTPYRRPSDNSSAQAFTRTTE